MKFGPIPLLLEKTFDESNLNEQALQLLRKGEATIVQISDKLYTLNLPEKGSLDDKVLDIFSESNLQKMLGQENEYVEDKKSDALDVD